MTNQQLYFAIGIPIIVYLLGFTTTILISFWQMKEFSESVNRRLELIEHDLKEFFRDQNRQDADIARLKDKTGLDKA